MRQRHLPHRLSTYTLDFFFAPDAVFFFTPRSVFFFTPGFGLFFEPGGRPSRVVRCSGGGHKLPFGRPRCSFWTRAIWPPRGEGSFSTWSCFGRPRGLGSVFSCSRACFLRRRGHVG